MVLSIAMRLTSSVDGLFLVGLVVVIRVDLIQINNKIRLLSVSEELTLDLLKTRE